MELIQGFLVVMVAAVLGGLIAKLLKFPVLVGYIGSGILFGLILPQNLKSVSGLAEIGTILLLFSVGLELSLTVFKHFFKPIIFGSILQMVLSTILFLPIFTLFHIPLLVAFILAIGFSLSSTAIVVKIMADRGETDTIHGRLMLGWLLVQDLAVIPIMVFLPLMGGTNNNLGLALILALIKATALVVGAIILGRIIAPKLIHKIAGIGSRELLLLTSFTLALGTAVIASFFGISPALGAFLAGVVISGSREQHAIFAETRPLRDLFMALFFVTLGFLVDPVVIFDNLILILAIALIVLIVKSIIIFVITSGFGYKGKTAVSTSFGLSQVGEFSFVIFSAALSLGIFSSKFTSIGICVTLLTLVVAPIVIKYSIVFWRFLKKISAGTKLSALFATGEKLGENTVGLQNHIIICGYGRVGSWVGKALSEYNIPFVVIDYSQTVIEELKNINSAVVYGDPTEPEVLDAAGVKSAKAIILAIPDRIAQETLISYVQTIAPHVKIISRVHEDKDWETLKILKVDKIIQPEFEAAIAIIKSVLFSRGKSANEINGVIKSLRLSHSK